MGSHNEMKDLNQFLEEKFNWKQLTHVCLAFLGPFRADDGGSAPDFQNPRMEREWRSSTES
jgi:hypothetical protein